jgi:hypothetical protein
MPAEVSLEFAFALPPLPPGAAYLDMILRVAKKLRAGLRDAAREAEGQGEAA